MTHAADWHPAVCVTVTTSSMATIGRVPRSCARCMCCADEMCIVCVDERVALDRGRFLSVCAGVAVPPPHVCAVYRAHELDLYVRAWYNSTAGIHITGNST